MGKRKAVLVILDGWGHSSTVTEGDAIKNTEKVWMKLLESKYPSFLLNAHGLHAGLPDNQMGNSEVGHLTIGSGRIIEQDIVRINREISEEKMTHSYEKPGRWEPLGAFVNERVHIIGLLSDGGVHSHINHIKSLVRNAPNAEVLIHAISDGRDTKPMCFLEYYNHLENFCKEIGKGKIVSVAGRFYTMDRDNRFERTDAAFRMMVGDNDHEPKGEDLNVEKLINNFYEAGETDEFIKPTLFFEDGKILKGEPVLFANFRADRMKQIVRKFEYRNPCFTLTEYDPKLSAKPLFGKVIAKNCLSEVLSNNKVKSLHIAETEKYAHVTYFLNGGLEAPFKYEERSMIQSPKVDSYDKKPEMSTFEVAEEVIKNLTKDYGFIVCNLAAPDMVGHTGNYRATCEAILAIDDAIGLLYCASKQNGYTLFITADHGNAEKMKDEDGNPVKTHTKNQVPFIVCNGKNYLRDYLKTNDGLECVAPTILTYLGINLPEEMTGKDLIVDYKNNRNEMKKSRPKNDKKDITDSSESEESSSNKK